MRLRGREKGIEKKSWNSLRTPKHGERLSLSCYSKWWISIWYCKVVSIRKLFKMPNEDLERQLVSPFQQQKGDLMMLMSSVWKRDDLTGWKVKMFLFWYCFFYVFLLHPKKIQVEIQIKCLGAIDGVVQSPNKRMIRLGGCVSHKKHTNFDHHLFLVFFLKPIYHLHLPFNTCLFQFPLWNLSSKWSPTARDAIVDQRYCLLASNGSSYLALSSVSRTYPSLPTGRILLRDMMGFSRFGWLWM